ncbi:MAG: AMP-binding protein [Gemmataceae bacterium]|nr:AMP-binding protein [Gemmataceae bacterium]
MEWEFATREAIATHQREALSRLLAEILPRHRFYAAKFGKVAPEIELNSLPFTTKAELLDDQQRSPPYGTLLTYPPLQYTRFNQTSGTHGTPLRWLDTPASWQWMLDCWTQVFATAGVVAGDRLFFAFSFGPFLGFWTAFEAGTRLGCLCLPGGGLSSAARLRMLIDNRATVVLCTPTYALRLAQVAQEQGVDLRQSGVRKIIVAGEPGGSIPATRRRIEESWNARVFDHHGMTEVGPMTIECPEAPGGLHVLEGDYVIEVIDPATTQPLAPGQVGELVVTNLGRLGSPLIRYRTGDLVRVDPKPCLCGRTLVRLAGGILGRSDDMISIRGNNFYPSALENVLRRFAEVVEYRVMVEATSTLAELRIEVEPTASAPAGLADTIAAAVRDELLFRADVTLVTPGSLPRYEMKAQRVHIKK